MPDSITKVLFNKWNNVEDTTYVDPMQFLSETRDYYKKQLQQGVFVVEFIKVDGSSTSMECTLNPQYIPGEAQIQESNNTRKQSETNIRVYSLDRKDWRSFRINSVTKFTPK